MIDRQATIEDMMKRGERLRELKMMALLDEEERRKADFEYMQDEVIVDQEKSSIVNMDLIKENSLSTSVHTNETSVTTCTASDPSLFFAEDKVDILPDSKQKVLRYQSYLAHQRYSDDYKHSNCQYIDFPLDCSDKKIIVEQQISLGKGGLLWDAGVILADHIIASEKEWKLHSSEGQKMTKIVELGAGIGLTGMAIAKAISDTEVTITDLPELLPIMERNVERNFDQSDIVEKDLDDSKTYHNRGEAAGEIPLYSDRGCAKLSSVDKCVLYDVHKVEDVAAMKESAGKIKAAVLRWGEKEDYQSAPHDVVIGGDVVASLYCPKALAQTIHDLCHVDSHVYMSLNKRLHDVLVEFDEAMKSLFHVVEEVEPKSRRKNENVFVLHATGKR